MESGKYQKLHVYLSERFQITHLSLSKPSRKHNYIVLNFPEVVFIYVVLKNEVFPLLTDPSYEGPQFLLLGCELTCKFTSYETPVL